MARKRPEKAAEMTPAAKRDEWARNFKACMSPESKLGALRGADRDGVLPEVLKALKISTAEEMFHALHRQYDV